MDKLNTDASTGYHGYHLGREGSRKTPLMRGHLSQDKALQAMWTRGKSIPDRGTSMGKGPGVKIKAIGLVIAKAAINDPKGSCRISRSCKDATS